MPKLDFQPMTFDDMQALNRHIKEHFPAIEGWGFFDGSTCLFFGDFPLITRHNRHHHDMAKHLKEQSERIQYLEDRIEQMRQQMERQS